MTRLPEPWGIRIDRSRSLRFTFEGKRFDGYVGDCIASALVASGQWILSRSFKYHRPRSVLSMAGCEANSLVQLPSEPNVQADRTPISEGLSVTAQNVNGSLEFDRNAVMDKLGRFMPVGFYYRTFMGPTRSSWLKVWEPLIRRKAGLGIINTKAPHRHYEKSHLFCDVLVVGAGPAGLSAAITAAAEAKAEVILVDENPEIGGALTYRRNDGAALDELKECAQAIPNLRIMTHTVCNGWFEDNWLPLIQGNHMFRTRAREVILATGTIEQPAIFRNNDLPGILLGSAAQRLMRHYAVRCGSRAVVLAANRDGYRVALDLAEVGVGVVALIDPRAGGSGGGLEMEVRRRGIEILSNTTIGEAKGTAGNKHLAKVRVGDRWIECDLLVVSVGLMPAWQLPCQAGAKLGYDEATGRFSLNLPSGSVGIAGSLSGHFGLDRVMADGRRAAWAALSRLGYEVREEPMPVDDEVAFSSLGLPIAAHPKGRDFIDFDEDVQVKDIQDAIKEGYRELELVKRFSTVGMGPSQGRHSALATTRIVAEATGCSVGEIGVTTSRPPVGPETLGLLAGHREPLERRTALHACHLALNAKMKPVGTWWRPYFYGNPTKTDELIYEEVAAVRKDVGILDVSTLGKLEVRGPDAGEFLDRLYTMAHANQPVGKVRYCLMLNEMGTVIDDGVAYRMADDKFYVTATTGAVARVHAEMLFWNTRWRLNVDVVNLTGAFCGLNITGPKAREVLGALESDIDFGRDAFRYLEGREGSVAGVPVRVMRIGFTGELSFELHCPSSYAPFLWNAVLAAGAPHGLRPYGLEASRILRLEKGHILIGQDTDALTTPGELGFEWAVSKRKNFFVGKRSIEMRTRFGEVRRLVGLQFSAGAKTVPDDSSLVFRQGRPVGHVTSIAYSPTLGSHIALAYVHIKDADKGKLITVKCRNGILVEAPVVRQAFFDPENTRQDV